MDELLRILSETCPGIDFENEKALIDDGLLDSLILLLLSRDYGCIFSGDKR